jgi:hypothetical protein
MMKMMVRQQLGLRQVLRLRLEQRPILRQALDAEEIKNFLSGKPKDLEKLLNDHPPVHKNGSVDYVLSGGWAAEILTGVNRAHHDLDIIRMNQGLLLNYSVDEQKPEDYFGTFSLTKDEMEEYVQIVKWNPRSKYPFMKDKTYSLALPTVDFMLVSKICGFLKEPRSKDYEDISALAKVIDIEKSYEPFTKLFQRIPGLHPDFEQNNKLFSDLGTDRDSQTVYGSAARHLQRIAKEFQAGDLKLALLQAGAFHQSLKEIYAEGLKTTIAATGIRHALLKESWSNKQLAGFWIRGKCEAEYRVFSGEENLRALKVLRLITDAENETGMKAALDNSLLEERVRIGKKKMFFINPKKGIRSKVYMPLRIDDFYNRNGKKYILFTDKKSTTILDDSLSECFKVPFVEFSTYRMYTNLINNRIHDARVFKDIIGGDFELEDKNYLVENARKIYGCENAAERFTAFLDGIKTLISPSAGINAYKELLANRNYAAAQKIAEFMRFDQKLWAYHEAMRIHSNLQGMANEDFPKQLNLLVELLETTCLKDQLDERIPLFRIWSNLLSTSVEIGKERMALFDRIAGLLDLSDMQINDNIANSYFRLSSKATQDNPFCDDLIDRFISLPDGFTLIFEETYRNELLHNRLSNAEKIRPRIKDAIRIEKDSASVMASRILQPYERNTPERHLKKYLIDLSQYKALEQLSRFADKSAFDSKVGERICTKILSGEIYLCKNFKESAEKIAEIYSLDEAVKNRCRLNAYSSRLEMADRRAVQEFRKMYGYTPETDTALFIAGPSKYFGPKSIALIDVNNTPEAVETAKALLKESLIGIHARNERTDILVRKFGFDKEYIQNIALEHLEALCMNGESPRMPVKIDRLIFGGYITEEDCIRLGEKIVPEFIRQGSYVQAGQTARYLLKDGDLAKDCIKRALGSGELKFHQAIELARLYGLDWKVHYTREKA